MSKIAHHHLLLSGNCLEPVYVCGKFTGFLNFPKYLLQMIGQWLQQVGDHRPLIGLDKRVNGHARYNWRVAKAREVLLPEFAPHKIVGFALRLHLEF